MYEVRFEYDKNGNTKNINISKEDFGVIKLYPFTTHAPTGNFQRADNIVQALIAADKAQESK